LSQGTAAAGAEAIVPLADGHQLAIDLGGAITFGDLKIARQMLSAGGAGGLRGYDVESLLGRWRGVARAEWRHLFSHELNFNLLHTLYLRGIAGAVFVEAGVVSPCESYRPDDKSFGADVGYTIRIFADWFGVSQTTLNLDLAVPLVTHADRTCFGQPIGANKIPFGFFFSFSPPW
jgi:hemolysin activation/secretion protein